MTVAAVLTVPVSWVYLRDMSHEYVRIRSVSTVLSSPFGDIEYTESGAGAAVLVIHGGGGGYDQGELVVQAVLGDEVRWIAPPRFGYLGYPNYPPAAARSTPVSTGRMPSITNCTPITATRSPMIRVITLRPEGPKKLMSRGPNLSDA